MSFGGKNMKRQREQGGKCKRKRKKGERKMRNGEVKYIVLFLTDILTLFVGRHSQVSLHEAGRWLTLSLYDSHIIQKNNDVIEQTLVRTLGRFLDKNFDRPRVVASEE
jgi:hypothetical protein